MTLSSRNKLFLLFCALMLAVAFSLFSLYIYAWFSNNIVIPPHIETGIKSKLSLISYRYPAVVLSIAALSLIAPAGVFLIYRSFEKTQAPEVFYFAVFFCGCAFEGLRLLIPAFRLWQSFSLLFLMIGKSIFFLRIFCPLCFFASALTSIRDQQMHLERNLIVIVAVAIIFAAVVPLNTAVTTGRLIIPWGYSILFILVRICIFIVTALTLFFTAIQHDNKDMIRSVHGYIMLAAGYVLLINTDNYAMLAAGLLLTGAGTYEYLTKTHHIYMWL